MVLFKMDIYVRFLVIMVGVIYQAMIEKKT